MSYIFLLLLSNTESVFLDLSRSTLVTLNFDDFLFSDAVGLSPWNIIING